MSEHERPAQYIEIEGVMWPPWVTKKSLKAMKEFRMREDDVWIVAYPKSGSHWVMEICELIVNNGNADAVDRKRSPDPIEFETPSSFCPQSLQTAHASYELASDWDSPRVCYSHMPVEYLPRQILDDNKGKVIYIARNPKDVAVSHFHFLKDIKPGAPQTFPQYLMEIGTSESASYKTWFGNVLGYWPMRNHQQFLFLKYEEMKLDTRGAVIQIADFMGRPLSDEVIDTIVDKVSMKSMKAQEKKTEGTKKILRKGIVGDWKNHFTVAENEAFDALYCRKMAGSGLSLQFE